MPNRSSTRRPRDLNHDYGDVYAVTFSPDGKLLATAGADGVVHLWDAVKRTPQ